jgi:uncharacterized membrane protein YhaH (DUF805 family)
MDWYKAAMQKYADFNGRSRRQEFWMFVLIYMLIYIASLVVYFVLIMVSGNHEAGGGGILPMLGGCLVAIVALAHLVPNIAVAVRRLHDTSRSGWWILIGLIPFIGAIVLLVFYCTDSTPGPNEYGPNPKGIGNMA